LIYKKNPKYVTEKEFVIFLGCDTIQYCSLTPMFLKNIHLQGWRTWTHVIPYMTSMRMILLQTDRLQAMWPTKTTEKEEGMGTSLSQQEL
jgi:hypothetical protein